MFRKKWVEKDNPGGGNCAYYSFANGILPYLQKEVVENKPTDSLYAKIAFFVESNPQLEINLEQLTHQIRHFNKNNRNGELLDSLNIIFRQLLIDKRLAELKQFIEEMNRHKENPKFNFKQAIEKNMVINDLQEATICLFLGVPRRGGKTEVERDSTTYEALNDIKANMLSQLDREIVLNKEDVANISDRMLFQCYLNLLAIKKTQFAQQDLIADKNVDPPLLTEAGRELFMQCRFNYREQEGYLEYKGQGLDDLIAYLNECLIQKHEIKRLGTADHPLLIEMLNQVLEGKLDAINNEKAFYLAGFDCVERQFNIIYDCMHDVVLKFKKLLSLKNKIEHVKIPYCLVYNEQLTREGLLYFLEAVGTHQNNRTSIAENFITDHLKNTKWGTDGDIRELGEILNVETHFTTYKQDRGDNPYVVYMNNRDNYHWTTYYENSSGNHEEDSYSSDEEDNYSDDEVLLPNHLTKYLQHSKGNPQLTLKEIRSLFQSYKAGNWHFFCLFNSRNHLDKATQIINRCHEKPAPTVESVVAEILKFRESPGRKFNNQGSFARRVDYLCYRMYGKDFIGYALDKRRKNYVSIS